MKSNRLKLFLGVIVTIVLGAIGSGFWDLALKPLWLSVSKMFFEVISSISSSFKESTYKDVAKGFREFPSIRAFSIALSLFFLYFSDKIPEFSEAIFKKPDNKEKIENELKELLLLSDENRNKRIEEIKSEFEKSIIKYNRYLSGFRYLTIFFVFLIIFLFSFMFFQQIQIEYVNSAVTHFEQVMTIASPFLSEKDRLKFRSEFSQISSSEDYKSVVEKLETVGKKNNQKIPIFKPW